MKKWLSLEAEEKTSNEMKGVFYHFSDNVFYRTLFIRGHKSHAIIIIRIYGVCFDRERENLYIFLFFFLSFLDLPLKNGLPPLKGTLTNQDLLSNIMSN